MPPHSDPDTLKGMAIPALTVAARCTVSVDAEGSEGSGVVVAHIGVNTYILTCQHVVGDAKKVKIGHWHGKKWRTVAANVEKTDVKADLALLRTVKRLEAPAISICAEEPELYERVYAIGTGSSLHGLASEGILCGVNGSSRGPAKETYVYTGLSCPGMSGGTLANDDGELVGIVMAVDRNGHLPIWSIGYAVSLGQIFAFLSPEKLVKLAPDNKKHSNQTRRKHR